MGIAEFTGRGAEPDIVLDTGRSASTDTAVWICAIVGMGGVGKTRLPIRAAHRLTRDGLFADVRLWTDLHGFHPEQPPTDPAVVLKRFLRTLGVQAHDIPDDVEERAGLYRARLDGRRALALLDDAADEAQVGPLLPGTPGNLVLITSRRSLAGLDGVTSVPLQVFTSQEALSS
ncbi:MAG TPA: NB-ARC domain-containing protein [Actinophytocola sp.]|jgi:predicted ATPase|nr:NB-ARC domain-containing protein [Actinophytocola sp.]